MLFGESVHEIRLQLLRRIPFLPGSSGGKPFFSVFFYGHRLPVL